MDAGQLKGGATYIHLRSGNYARNFHPERSKR